MADLTVANTILAQMGGHRRLSLMIGARCFVGDSNSLQFGFRGCPKANKCRVILEPSDMYRLELWKFNKRTGESHMVVEYDGLYFDQLAPTFEGETGLYLSF